MTVIAQNSPTKFDICLISGFLFNFACVTAQYWGPYSRGSYPPYGGGSGDQTIQSGIIHVQSGLGRGSYPRNPYQYYGGYNQPYPQSGQPYPQSGQPYPQTGQSYPQTVVQFPGRPGGRYEPYRQPYGGYPPQMSPPMSTPMPYPSYPQNQPQYPSYQRPGYGYPPNYQTYQPPYRPTYPAYPPQYPSYPQPGQTYPPSQYPPTYAPWSQPPYNQLDQRQGQWGQRPQYPYPRQPSSAYANLKGAETNGVGVGGEVKFVQQDHRFVGITGRIIGLTPGAHGFHIHENAVKEGVCEALGDHFNPTHAAQHGGKSEWIRHAGDLGNIFADHDGIAYFDITDTLISLVGPNSIVNRTLVVTENADDLGKVNNEDSKKNGNSGKPVACGTIMLTANF